MIDFNFIQDLEGYELVGYVPTSGNSGVTIASGFDIGQRSIDELEKAFDEDLVSKLEPYVGLKRADAEIELDRTPLIITNSEALVINEYAHNQVRERLLDDWCGSMQFDSLSDECQTVVASVAFQYGSLATKCPNFWRQVTNGDWFEAYKNLCDFGDAYGTRRRKEAALLGSWINKQLKK